MHKPPCDQDIPQPLSERLDKSRGDYDDGDTGDQPKDTNYAESLYNLVCRLELETSGPEGME